MRSDVRTTRCALALLLLAGAPFGLAAQAPDWNAFLTVRPNPSPYIADWENDPTMVTFVLSYTGSAGVSFHLNGRILRGGASIIAGRSSAFEFVRPAQLVLTTRDGIWETNSVTYESALRAQLERTGRIPEGDYQFCAEAREGLPEASGGRLLAIACEPFTITAPEPPSLILPGDADVVAMARPMFIWTPVISPPGQRVSYHVRIAEVLPGQSPLEAINGIPQFEGDFTTTSFLYPIDALPLRDGARYVWQVQGVDAVGEPLGERRGKSEAWWFSSSAATLARPATIAGRMPDTLTLLAGRARLRGLRSLAGVESDATYTLSGNAVLEVEDPSLVAAVTLHDLVLDKASLLALIDDPSLASAPPVYLAGRITGRVDTTAGRAADRAASDAGGSGSHRLVRFTTAEFTVAGGLALGGELMLADRPPLLLAGRARLTPTGMTGTLSVQAPRGATLATVGDDPVALDLQRAEITYPAGTLGLTGALRLFNRPAACDSLRGTAGIEGRVTFDVRCVPRTPLRLVPDADVLELALAGIAGSVELNTADGRLDRSRLTLTGEVRLTTPTAPGAVPAPACGAALDITIAAGAVSSSARPAGNTCAASGAIPFGWMTVRVSSLTVDRFGYSAGRGFDLALRASLDVRAGGDAGLMLPPISGVIVNTSGLVLPATDVARPMPRADLLGFGVSITRMRVPAIALSWSDWRARITDRFRFALDVALTLPELASAPTSCRTTQPIPVSGAELAAGRLRASLGDRAFNPACDLAIAPNTRLEVTRVTGALAFAFAPSLVLQEAPEIEGALILPPLFTCQGDDPDRRLRLTTAGGAAARLRLGAHGRVVGTASGLAPRCPLELPAARVAVTDATLVLSETDGVQSARLSGTAAATLTLSAVPVSGTGTVDVDLLRGTLVAGRLDFPGPVRLGLPREQPVFSVEVARAALDAGGLHVDGNGRLLLAESQAIEATFEALTLRPDSLTITSGQVLFRAPFALEIGIAGQGGLAWRAVPRGAPLGVATGARLDLPTLSSLSASGFRTSGNGAGRLVFGGQDLDALAVTVSNDFALGLSPAGVRQGRAELRLQGDRVAYVDREGLHPDLARFASSLLPARLGLPSAMSAYLALRDDTGRLLVRAEQTAQGIRVYTSGNATLDLVVPALQRGAAPPRLSTSLDVTLDPLGTRVSRGTVRVVIPDHQRADFGIGGDAGPQIVRFTELAFAPDSGLTLAAEIILPGSRAAPLLGRARLTAGGLEGTLAAEAAPGTSLLTLGDDPVRVRVRRAAVTLPSAEVELTAALDLFRQDLGCTETTGRIATGGTATFTAACTRDAPVSLVSDVERLRLTLHAVTGSLSFDLGGRLAPTYDLTVPAELRLDAGAAATAEATAAAPAAGRSNCGAHFDITLRDGTVSARGDSFRSRCMPDEGSADLGWLRLRLSNLALERFSYERGAGFDFALRMDVAPSVPAAPTITLPTLVGVVVSSTGIALPATDAPVTRGPVSLAGFGLNITRVRLPAFTLAWRDWQARSAEGFRFGFEGQVTLPSVRGGAPSCLEAEPITLGLSELAGGRIRFALEAKRFATPCEVPLATETRFAVEQVGGAVSVLLAPTISVEEFPEIQGALLLPSFFSCGEGNASRRLSLGSARLRLSAGGLITGTVAGLNPGCPITLAAMRVELSAAELRFAVSEGVQSAVLAGAATATFTLAQTPVRGTGALSVDLLAGRMLTGRVNFPGPFRFDLPREQPVLSFMIEAASLDTAGLHIEGRNRLTFADGQSVGAVFDTVIVNPQDLRLTAGRVRFEAPFAFEVGIGPDGALGWRAAPRGSALAVETGLRVDLPTSITLGPDGFTSRGDGMARLRFNGADVDSLDARFSDDFAIGLRPFGVGRGLLDFLRAGESMGYIDPLGFHPNVAYFADVFLPARLGLPSEEIAYLQLRDANGSLLVDVERSGNGVRLRTRAGGTVPFVFPSLQLGAAEAPQVDAAFDITLDPFGRTLTAGAIRVSVPPGQRGGFDLSARGLPVAIDSVAYESDGGAYRLTLAGQLALFGARQAAAGALRLMLDGGGRLSGDVLVAAVQRVPLVATDTRLAFAMTEVRGRFDALLRGGPLRFDLDVEGAIDLAVSDTGAYRAAATLHVSDRGMSVTRLELPPAGTPRYLDGGPVRLGLSNLRVPLLAFDYGSGRWDFELLFDAQLEFPTLAALALPTVRDIALTREGFALPAISIPELTADSVRAAGFWVRPMAFRMAPLRVAWFGGALPDDWGFAFDLALGFAAGAPQALRDRHLSVLNAGYRRGRFTGAVEPRDLPDPIRVALGDSVALLVRRLGGALTEGANASQEVSVTAGGSLSVPPLMRCESQPSVELPMPNATLTLSSNGRVSGDAYGIVPACPVRLGPVAMHVDSSSLHFASDDAGQRVELFMRGAVRLPGPTPGQTVTAAGELGLDLGTRRITRGLVDITTPFRWNIPSDSSLSQGVPLFTFTVQRGRIDRSGLHLTGAGQLDFWDWDVVEVAGIGDAGAIGEAHVEVTFDDLTIGLPDLAISAGRVGFARSFALDAGFDAAGRLRWRAKDTTENREAGTGLRVIAPQQASFGGDGLRLDGTATAALTYADTTLGALQVRFRDGFLLGYQPVGVASGRADFLLDNVQVAYIDRNGFWPGNIFGVLPVPARLGLPTEAVAYLQLRDSVNVLLIETVITGNEARLRTRAGRTVKLVVPALGGAGPDAGANAGAPASVDVALDVTVNAASFAFVRGSVRAIAPQGGAPLFALDRLGLPLEILEVAYEPTPAGGYALHLDARAQLPASLGGVDVIFSDLVVSEQGLSGTAETGRYTQQLDPDAPAIAQRAIGSDLVLAVMGARATFGGATPAIALSGVLRSPLFAPTQGDPVAIFYTAALSANGLALTVDPRSLPDGRLPIALATFEPMPVGAEPAIAVRASNEEFAVRVSGVLRAPTVSDGFAVTIAGLEVGTRGVVLPTVAITGPEGQQTFSLFGATFTLRDSQGQPAIALGYANRVLALTLSGELEFLGNRTPFRGLRVASDGSVSLASANLLSAPVVLAERMLTLDSLTIREGRLRADLGVVLPAPLGEDTSQRANFSIGPDGSVDGGATIVLKNETQGLGGDRTQHTVGLATLHPRYVALELDLGSLSNSALLVVADVYLQEEGNRILLGDVVGGVVSPGLRVGFDGSAQWGNVALARAFDFDFEAVRLTLTQVSAAVEGSSFVVGFSGQLALNLSAVSGSVDFVDFRITDRGRVQFNPSGVQGGEFSIAGVVNLQMQGFQYSDTPTSIQVTGGGMPTANAPATSGTETVQVASFIRFGGRIDLVDIMAGGVEEFVLYRTAGDGRTNMIVRNAQLDVHDVIQMRADLRYRELPAGFELLLGAQGKILKQYDVMMVGALEKSSEAQRFGAFIAAGVTIPLPTPVTPVIVVTELGGGFFYNPKPEYLALVRQYANLDGAAAAKVTAPPGEFAVLLYGGAMVTPAGVARGRVLLTLMPNAIQIDGKVNVLNQGERFEGEMHLVMGLKQAYAEGNIALTVDYDPVLSGFGELEFFVYGADVWGIAGRADASYVNTLEGTAELFIGPPGFIVTSSIEAGFDIWVLDVSSDIAVTAWYQRSANEWGAYTRFTAEMSVAGGAVTVKGTLKGALILRDGQQPLIYAAGKLTAKTAFASYSRKVWGKFNDGDISGGLGSNSELDAVLAEAAAMQEEMLAARDDAQEALNEAQIAASGYSDEQLAAAYGRIQGWSASQFGLQALASILTEQIYRHSSSDDAYYQWYLNLVRQSGLPQDSLAVHRFGAAAQAAKRTLDARRGQVSQRVAQIQAMNLALESVAEEPLPETPVRMASFAPPVTRSGVNEFGDSVKVLESGPTFAVDVDAARAAEVALIAEQAAAERADEQVRAKMLALEDGLARLRGSVTSRDDGSLLGFLRTYADAQAANEGQVAAQADLLLRKQDWFRAAIVELQPDAPDLRSVALTPAPTTAPAGQAATITATSVPLTQRKWEQIDRIIRNKSEALRYRGDSLRTLARRRYQRLSAWTGDGLPLVTYEQVALNYPDGDQFFVTQADLAGRHLWIQLALAGMRTADGALDLELATTRAEAAARLGAMNAERGVLSQTFDRLALSHAALSGTLYDLYDSYLLGHPSEAGGGASPPYLAALRARRETLLEELSVPRIDGVQATATTNGYYSTQTFEWTGWHPRGTYEFSYRDGGQSDVSSALVLASSGDAGRLTTHRFAAGRGASEPARSFQAGVRGGAGFTGLGRTDYLITYAPPTPRLPGMSAPTTASTTTTSGQLADATPPAPPIVTFPGHPIREIVGAHPEAWTTRGDRFDVHWNALDPESGIAEYQYALGRSAQDVSVRSWQSMAGRPGLTINDVPVRGDQPLYVSVRARNGQGLWSEIGVSPGLRLDATPPVLAAGARIDAGAVDSATTALSVPLAVAACPVPLPGYPGAPLDATIGRRTDADATATSRATGTPWGGSLSSGNAAPPGETAAPVTRAPERSFTFPAATDAESGIRQYHWSLHSEPTTTFGTGWVATGNADHRLTIRGTPLDYRQSFHLSALAESWSGQTSEIVTFGPFALPDPTAPTWPTLCAGFSGTPGHLSVLMLTPAQDPETEILGYQYRVSAGATVVRNWPLDNMLDWSRLEASTAQQTGALPLVEGSSYALDVRALNGHRQTSRVVTSGPVSYDVSAPPTPTVSASMVGATTLRLVINAVADPHTGILAQQLAIGTTQEGANVVGWSPVPNARTGAYEITLSLDAQPATGATWWVQLRTINGAGLPGAIARASFRRYVPPIVPTRR